MFYLLVIPPPFVSLPKESSIYICCRILVDPFCIIGQCLSLISSSLWGTVPYLHGFCLSQYLCEIKSTFYLFSDASNHFCCACLANLSWPWLFGDYGSIWGPTLTSNCFCLEKSVLQLSLHNIICHEYYTLLASSLVILESYIGFREARGCQGNKHLRIPPFLETLYFQVNFAVTMSLQGTLLRQS